MEQPSIFAPYKIGDGEKKKKRTIYFIGVALISVAAANCGRNNVEIFTVRHAIKHHESISHNIYNNFTSDVSPCK